jgi:hypothetical protein
VSKILPLFSSTRLLSIVVILLGDNLFQIASQFDMIVECTVEGVIL